MVALKGWRELQRALGLKSSRKSKTQSSDRHSLSSFRKRFSESTVVALKGVDNEVRSIVSVPSASCTENELTESELFEDKIPFESIQGNHVDSNFNGRPRSALVSSSSDGTTEQEMISDREGLRVFRITTRSSERRKSHKARPQLLKPSKSTPVHKLNDLDSPIAAERRTPTTRLQILKAPTDRTDHRTHSKSPRTEHLNIDSYPGRVPIGGGGSTGSRIYEHASVTGSGKLKSDPGHRNNERDAMIKEAYLKISKSTPTGQPSPLSAHRSDFQAADRFFPATPSPLMDRRRPNPERATVNTVQPNSATYSNVKPLSSALLRSSTGPIETYSGPQDVELTSHRGRSLSAGAVGGLSTTPTYKSPLRGGDMKTLILAPSPRQVQKGSKMSELRGLALNQNQNQNQNQLRHRHSTGNRAGMTPERPSRLGVNARYGYGHGDGRVASPVEHLRRGVQVDMIGTSPSAPAMLSTRTQNRPPPLHRSASSGRVSDLPWKRAGLVNGQHSQSSDGLIGSGTPNNRVRWNPHTDIAPTYGRDIYGREVMELGDQSPDIYYELMAYKIDEMMVHRDSTQNTN
ncbi:hypothetical protein SARC_10505 [Sphaeroforma arctica JP610]|uniref:Uncharacterized protein n=1 Tax=Sphaeroforma arctica JP610 TaxID=667725 RepID=A0A0L0FKM6_9EUKA|nr:hypothetical protein SARC_10505 [Sphaeroforma arctica JP610]KNC77021.1 hypothetical protein SARC_10505 [Sphaeroforma arctica JP610]|eukprot:XP_014150923.1 hypothetical protein SARC_10505 [Sphaeroforma arctica JP610]